MYTTLRRADSPVPCLHASSRTFVYRFELTHSTAPLSLSWWPRSDPAYAGFDGDAIEPSAAQAKKAMMYSTQL